MNTAWKYILARLVEPSTWRAFVSAGMAIGLGVSPEEWAKILAGGFALQAFIGAFFADILVKPPATSVVKGTEEPHHKPKPHHK